MSSCGCSKPADVPKENKTPSIVSMSVVTDKGQRSSGCGCGGPVEDTDESACDSSFVTGQINTLSGSVPVVSTHLILRDHLGAFKSRWGINRMNYRVKPGLYAIGNPTTDAPVIVTANYKLTFDVVRRDLHGQNLWALVLDTKGINVWCAAGKGTFGTDELIGRINAVKLPEQLSTRTLILPQLGAPGVSAHNVTGSTGFRIVYGPVYARDIPAFIESGMKKTESMKQVNFTFRERIALVPMEIVGSLKAIPFIFTAGIAFAALESMSFSFSEMGEGALLLGSVLCGGVIVPAALPLLRVKPFSAKGFIVGALFVAMAALLTRVDPVKGIAWALIVASISGYLALQFTGASVFTSETAVRREIRFALPVLGISFAMGIILRIAVILRVHGIV